MKPKQAGVTVGLPRPVENHAITQNFHSLIARIDELEPSPTPATGPRFRWFSQEVSGADTVSMSIRIEDAQNLGGTLRLWVNKDSYDPGDPGMMVEGTLEIASTPATVTPGHLIDVTGGGTDQMLADIMVTPGDSKSVFLEFVNSESATTGVQEFVLTGP